MTAFAVLAAAARAVARRPLRSALGAITAAAAVATVSATRSLVRGSEVALERDLTRLGVRTIAVVEAVGFLPRGAGAAPKPLGAEDAAAAREALRAAGVAAEVVEARVRLGTVALEGGPPVPVPAPVIEAAPAYFRTFEAELVEGRLLEEADARPGAPAVCVLDLETARALGGVRAGGEVVLREGGSERRAQVVGVLADPFRLRPAEHAPDLTGAARPAIHQVLGFRNAYVPSGAGRGSMFLLAVVEKRAEASRAHDALEIALGARERGLVVWSRGTWVRSVMELFSEQTAAARVIEGVVLAVALVLVATVTLVGVRQRVSEVAIRRAEGATRAQVTGQLLGEGAMTALAGGLLGVPAGLLAAELLSGILTWRPEPEASAAAGAVALGTLVGTLASALPAWAASRWPVVEGLRRGA